MEPQLPPKIFNHIKLAEPLEPIVFPCLLCPNMPVVLSTVKSVSAPRQRNPPAQKAPPIPTQQRKEKLAERQERQRQIDDAVSEWYSYTLAKADELGKRFDKKPRYFLDIFFQGGAKMVNHHHKTNAYNAFKSIKAAELNDG
jgi:hypothetical protein